MSGYSIGIDSAPGSDETCYVVAHEDESGVINIVHMETGKKNEMSFYDTIERDPGGETLKGNFEVDTASVIQSFRNEGTLIAVVEAIGAEYQRVIGNQGYGHSVNSDNAASKFLEIIHRLNRRIEQADEQVQRIAKNARESDAEIVALTKKLQRARKKK